MSSARIRSAAALVRAKRAAGEGCAPSEPTMRRPLAIAKYRGRDFCMEAICLLYGVIVSVCVLVPTPIVTAWPPVFVCVAIVNVVDGAPWWIVTVVGTVTALAPARTEIGKVFPPAGAGWPMDTVEVTLPP